MRRRSRSLQALVLLIALLLYLGSKSLPHSKSAATNNAYYRIERVVDGDTFELSNGQRVRLIGVDTPEIHYSDKLLRDARNSKKGLRAIQRLGYISKNFVQGLADKKQVRLEFDVERYDRYGRLLAYAYLEDGTFVNARIIEEGYGSIMTVPPNVKYADHFLALDRKARSDKKGLWQDRYAD